MVKDAECICGAGTHAVTLPTELAQIAGYEVLWVHTGTNDIYCYPNDPAAWATPIGREGGDS